MGPARPFAPAGRGRGAEAAASLPRVAEQDRRESEHEHENESEATSDPEAAEEDAPASTPFDNPFFLPVVLLGFAVWFTYDGWFNPEMEWVKFNRVGALITWALGLFFGVRAVRERRAGSGSEGDGPPAGSA